MKVFFVPLFPRNWIYLIIPSLFISTSGIGVSFGYTVYHIIKDQRNFFFESHTMHNFKEKEKN